MQYYQTFYEQLVPIVSKRVVFPRTYHEIVWSRHQFTFLSYMKYILKAGTIQFEYRGNVHIYALETFFSITYISVCLAKYSNWCNFSHKIQWPTSHNTGYS